MAKRTARLARETVVYPRVLPARVLRLLNELSRLPELRSFYLGGGSGLALHLGHRESDDLGFFSPRSFRPELLARALTTVSAPQGLHLGDGSIECWMARFKVQLLHYPYRLLRPLHRTKYGPLADPLDIALMKLIAISQRGSKRDFVDLACFLRQYPHISLGGLLELLRRKYGKINRAHQLRALVYFADAESEPMPRMRWSLPWNEVKTQLEEAVREILR